MQRLNTWARAALFMRARLRLPAQMHMVALLAAPVLLLGGCASTNMLQSDVSTFGDWPASSSAKTYVFERLPSQQADAERQLRVETAARGALAAAGFTPAADLPSASYTVQLGAKVEVTDRSPFDDPLWWHGGLYRWRHGYPGWSGFGGWGGTAVSGGSMGAGLGFGEGFDNRRYEREVLVLIRDRATSTPVFEARASNRGVSSSIDQLLSAMFEAALKDFPRHDVKPRSVTTSIAP